jgi:hypothetical protein
MHRSATLFGTADLTRSNAIVAFLVNDIVIPSGTRVVREPLPSLSTSKIPARTFFWSAVMNQSS